MIKGGGYTHTRTHTNSHKFSFLYIYISAHLLVINQKQVHASSHSNQHFGKCRQSLTKEEVVKAVWGEVDSLKKVHLQFLITEYPLEYTEHRGLLIPAVRISEDEDFLMLRRKGEMEKEKKGINLACCW